MKRWKSLQSSQVSNCLPNNIDKTTFCCLLFAKNDPFFSLGSVVDYHSAGNHASGCDVESQYMFPLSRISKRSLISLPAFKMLWLMNFIKEESVLICRHYSDRWEEGSGWRGRLAAWVVQQRYSLQQRLYKTHKDALQSYSLCRQWQPSYCWERTFSCITAVFF